MNPKTQATLGVTTLAAALVAGCSLTRPEGSRKDPEITKVGASGGQVVEPKRCMLTVSILTKPFRDKVVNDAVWSLADEQAVGPETRRVLAANGLRIGVIEGNLPAEVEAALHAPPPDKIEPIEFNLPDGLNTLVVLAESAPQVSLLLSREGKISGKDYQQASGFFRVTANQSGPTGVALRFVPEVHHGAMTRRYDGVPTDASNLNPMQFTVKDGQQQETLRDLAANLTVQPGQTAVIGADPERPGSLGYFLFTQPEPNSDRLLQKVVLIKASRTNLGLPGSDPAPSARPEPIDSPPLPPLPFRKATSR